MAYVIDPSLALAWLLPDERNQDATAVRQAIEDGDDTWIPAHWWLEIGNALLMAERKGRITPEQTAQAFALIDALPLEQDEETAEHIGARTISLARKHRLAIYDAAYLELAQRRGALLATFDAQLIAAAAKEGVSTPRK